MNTTVDRDERTISVEDASYRRAFRLLSFGVLLSAAYRSYWRHEAAWDLLALVVAAGGYAAAYQAALHVRSRRWATTLLLAAAVGAIVAMAIVWLR